MAIKTISIPDEQAKWVEDNNISLSKLVQSKIQEDMEKAKKK